jgi:uncharacterized membrane protein
MTADCGLGPATSSIAKGNNPAIGPTWSPRLVWPFPPKLALLVLLAVVALAGWLHPAPLFAAPTITYVQGNYATPQTSEMTVNVTFNANQAAGDLNVVVVGWNDTTAMVSTVTDDSGNTYARAVGPTIYSSSTEPFTQSIYYAKNIAAAAAGANSVTVTFSPAAAYPDIRILEYSGADRNNPVDVTAASSGSSTTSSSGSATTTNPTDLLFGANIVWTFTTGAGTGLTQRLLTSPDGDIAEDRIVTAAGSYSATAPLGGSAEAWVMQMVAFRTAAVAVGSFTLSAIPASLSVAQGNQGTSTITTTVSGSFSSAISLSASGVPSGTTVSFNPSSIAAPGAGNSTMTITVGSSTAVGTYPITVTGSGGGIQQRATVTLTVTPAPNFTLSASPASVSVVQGNQGTSTITTTVSGSFSSAISLSATGAPSGTTVSFNPSTITAPGAGNSTMKIALGSSTAVGTYPITVTGSGGGMQQSATVTLTVTAAPNFTLTGSPASLSVAQGNQGTSTITTTVSGGFNSAIGLSATGAPSGTTVSFNPSTIAAPGGGSSAMTIAVGSSTAVGTYSITVTGSGGGMQQSATVTLTVGTAIIAYVQGNAATPQTSETTVNVTFNAAQAAGDLNVVVVGWNDTTAMVSTVTDSSGNAYTRAVGPTVLSGDASQSIYYAKNIAAAAAGANSVTVTFSPAAAYPDIRILEYSGADPNNPVDVTAASSGSSTTSNSGSATTTNATDLLFGANFVATLTAGSGSGFTQRVLTSPDGDIAEDEMVTATGSYSATAPLNRSGWWLMQMVAFRTPAQANFALTGSPASVSVATGNQGTFTITTAVSGGFNSAISLSASGTPSGTTVSFNPSTIAAPGAGNSTMTITVGAGTAVGTYPITVTANGGGTQHTATVSLTVTGTPTFTLSTSPASTGFGNVMLGSSSTLPVILTNTGTGSVTISQDSVTGSGFSISGPSLPFTLSAGQNMDFSLTFAPTAVGSVTGNASVLSNATNSPSNEPLSGTGMHAVSLSWTGSTTTVAGYNVYRGGQSGGPYTLLNSALLSGETYVDSTVQAGQTFYYVTTAVNSADVESQYSNQVQAAVPSP